MTIFYIKMKIRTGGGSFRAGGGSFRAAGCSPLLFLFVGNTNASIQKCDVFYSDSTWRQFVTFKMREGVVFEKSCC